ncbi:hypothetical protein K469DRAFT_711597, partial [Zopfia rhizophila CBS 207.26]
MNRNSEKVFKQRVARENRRNPPLIPPSVALEPDDAPDDAPDDDAPLIDSDDRKAYWIYNYGWPLWHRRRQKSTHLSAHTPGHGYNRDGKINFALPPNTSSI